MPVEDETRPTRETDGAAVAGDEGDRGRLIRSRLLLFLIVLAIYGTSPVVTNGDSFLVTATAQSLLHHQDLDIDEYLGPGTDGGQAYLTGPAFNPGHMGGIDLPRALPPRSHAYDFLPWLTSLLVVPIVALFELGGAVGVARLDVDRMLATGDIGLVALVGGSLLTASSVLALSTLAWHGLRLPATKRRRWAFLIGLVVALGTPAWSTLSRAPWSQTTSVLFSSLAVLAAYRLARMQVRPKATRLSFLLGAAAAAAYAARPTAAVLVVALGSWLLLTDRPSLRQYMVGGAAVALPWFAVNLATWGQLQPPYFSTGRAGLGPNTLQGIAANLISPNRGLLVFSSVTVMSGVGLALAMRGRGPVPRGLAVTAAAVVVAHLVVVSGSGEAWWAGASYGPRFMADLLPVLLLLALPAVEAVTESGARLAAQRAVLALVALSIVMNAPGAWSKPAHCWNLDPVRVDSDPGRVWDWGDMQALRPLRVIADGGSPRDVIFERCDDSLDRRDS